MKRSDVQTHVQGYYGDPLPAVNIKVYGSVWDVKLPLTLGMVSENNGPLRPVLTDPAFTHEWVTEHVSEDMLNEVFWFTCQSELNWLDDNAHEIFGPNVETWTEGRSGGWLVVNGLPDLERWGGVLLAKWAKFSNIVREVVDHVPEAILESVYANEFEAWEPEVEGEY